MKTRGLLDLIISILPGLKPAEKITLLNSFVHEEELYLQPKKYIEEVLSRPIKENWDMLEFRNKADRIDTICKVRSVQWVSLTEESYPPLLREIFDPPAVIFYRGCLADPQKPLLGMVGTRKPSPQAASQAFKIACEAGKAGISVVSGLALGIDAMSHRGNLAGSAPGYAVLGSGPDEIYPSSNRQLAKKILNSGGAIISEYPPGVRPAKWNFPARNRIISALSRSVLIVQAPQKSGALITADFALEQGRDLWVASEGVNQQAAPFDNRGSLKLVQDGAEIIYSINDILEKWNMEMTQEGDDIVSTGKTDADSYVNSLAKFLQIDIKD